MIELKLAYSKETKNTYVYVSESTEAVPTLYIRKDAFTEEAPENVTILIKPSE